MIPKLCMQFVCAMALSLGMCTSGSAGVVTASIRAGATALVSWKDVNSPDLLGSMVVTDDDSDGVIEFLIPLDDQSLPGLIIALCWEGNFSGGITDTSLRGHERFEAPISVFEPFRFAQFTAEDTSIRILTEMVADQVIADGGADALFDPIERLLSVRDGLFSDGRTSGLRFRDARSLSDDPSVRIRQLLDRDLLAGLPLFNGRVVLQSSGIDMPTRVDTFSPIAEPPTLSIVAIALVGLAALGLIPMK